MGYYVEFKGVFEITPVLSEEHRKILEDFFCEDREGDEYPSPSCDYRLDKRGRYLFPLDGRTRKFSSWLAYIKENYLDKWGYRLSGTVLWRGENTGDAGDVTIDDDGDIVVAWLWDDFDEIMSRLPHVDVENQMKKLDFAEDYDELREFDVQISFNKKLTKKHEKWLSDFNKTCHYVRRNLDEDKFGRDGELFIEPWSKDNEDRHYFLTCSEDEFREMVGDEGMSEEEILLHRTPAGDCPDLFCQWTAEKGKLVCDNDRGFPHAVEWLDFLIKKFFAPNGYVLNGKIRWNGCSDFYDRGTIFVKDNKVAAYVLPFLKPLEKRVGGRYGYL